MRQPGMTLIVKNTARLVGGFIAVFGIYIALTGHLSPGGGFAGGVILAAAGVLVVLSFGHEFVARRTSGMITEPACHVADAAGACLFLAVALLGYLSAFHEGAADSADNFFRNFMPPGKLHHLVSGGTIPITNLAILVKVAAGLVGAFLALAAFRRARTEPGDEIP